MGIMCKDIKCIYKRFKWRKLKINVGKSKVMKLWDTGEKCNIRIKVKEKVLEEVDTFRYLEANFSGNGGMDAKLNHTRK